ncbi:recombinase zinc ribbon domain-containing protein [Flindersiella endophytica]
MPKEAADRFRRAEQPIPHVSGEQVRAEREAITKGTQDHLDGVTLAAIATEWNTWSDVRSLIWTGDAADGEVAEVDGLRTATGGTHNDTTVRMVLSRASNAGLIEHDGVIVGKAKDDDGNLLNPIVAEEQWSQVRAVFASRSVGRPVTGVNLLSGILRCALCGTGLVSKAKGGTYYPDGSPVRRYLCNNKPACGKVLIDQRRADAVVRDLTLERLADPRHAEQVKQRSKAVAELDAKIADAETTARQVGARLGEGKITLDRHDAIMEPLDRRLAKLHADRDALLQHGPTSTTAAASGGASVAAAGVSSASQGLLADLEAQWGQESHDAPPEEIAEANQRLRALIGKALPLGLAVAPATARGGGRFDTDRIKPIQRPRATPAA